MKKILLSILMLSFGAISVQAQHIRVGDKFWDGEVLYTAQGNGVDYFYLTGEDVEGGQHHIILTKNGTKAGEYKLTQGVGDEEAPYGCLFGSRVQYIRQDGMYFLCFYPEEHTLGQALVLTPDNLQDCAAQQKHAEDECDPMEMVSMWLMNHHYVKSIHPEVLQGMLNKLDAKKQKTIIERTNQDIIAYILATGQAAVDYEPEDDDVEDVPMEEITITDERDFVVNLKSNRIIHIPDGIQLNLSDILNKQNVFNFPGRLWTNDYYSQREGTEELVVSCNRHDGRQLDLVNIHNLKIIGGKGSSIVVEPRYANVLNFYQCTNITLENLTIGHTEEGYCEGGVIYAKQCELFNINKCDLYGCGTYGIEAEDTRTLVMEKSVIRDCSYGILRLLGTQYCTFIDCDFVRCREFDLVGISNGCESTRFINCRFAQNHGMLFNLYSKIILQSCEIHHPKGEALGIDDASNIEYANNKTRWFRDDKPLSKREIGPE